MKSMNHFTSNDVKIGSISFQIITFPIFSIKKNRRKKSLKYYLNVRLDKNDRTMYLRFLSK